MPNDEKTPTIPTATDIQGVPIIGTKAFYILDKALTIDERHQPNPAQMWDLGFNSNPVPGFRPGGGAPQLPYAPAATWVYTSMALGRMQQEMEQRFTQMAKNVDDHLAELWKFSANVGQTLSNVLGHIDTDSAEFAAIRRELQELLDQATVLVPEPHEGAEDVDGAAAESPPEPPSEPSPEPPTDEPSFDEKN